MRNLYLLAAIAIGLLLSGCTTTAGWDIVHGLAAAVNGNQPTNNYTPTESTISKLMIFGGEQHNVYLGCLNCSEYSSDSVLNSYGSYGSSYASTSIYNLYSQYGSLYAATSACNSYASNPPVVVDSAGNFYGYLTINQYKSGALTDPKIVAWLHGVCGG